MAAASFLALIPFVAGVQAGRQPASHANNQMHWDKARAICRDRTLTTDPAASERVGHVQHCALTDPVRKSAVPVRSDAVRDRTYLGLTAERWHAKFVHMRRLAYVRGKQARSLRRTLTHTPTVREAITLACQTYGSCAWLWRVAECESGFNPTAKNASGSSGTYQFMPSTWATTPYGSSSIWSPYASALAAGWMKAHGRGGEWVCQ